MVVTRKEYAEREENAVVSTKVHSNIFLKSTRNIVSVAGHDTKFH